ncbi:hypothetical protein OH76DRAFT_563267 [Lentinus brumalis]|uniref:Uncharacterized protein n=1 Tax=Lentinus brumalis TaxID=2498619 RepID=A0A371DT71_9APHY|nr:hypothetical protein OH76DRAFT_563267 [Polyporus brumalis]
MPPSPKKQKVPVNTVRQRGCVAEKVRVAHAGRISPRPSAKADIIGTSNGASNITPSTSNWQVNVRKAKPKVAPAKPLSKPSSSKNIMQATSVAKQAPIFIDLTVSSDSDSEGDCQPLVRHTFVNPRIPRPSLPVSKRPTPARAVASPLPGSLALIRSAVSSSESDDEMMLESMLIADHSGSDMDCGSSDVETLANPSKTAPLLPWTGFGGVALDISQPTSHMPRTVFLR